MPDIDTMNKLIAGEVRAEMSRQKVKQTHLARYVFGTYPQWVQARVNGDVPMTAAELIAIADYLQVTVVQFLNAVHPGETGPSAANTTPPHRVTPRRRNNLCYSDPRVIKGPWPSPSVSSEHAA